MSDYAFMNDVPEEEVKQKGFAEMPKGDYDVVLEVVTATVRSTSANDGEMVKIGAKIVSGKWKNRRAWRDFYTKTTNPAKAEGAKNGARDFTKLAQATGIIVKGSDANIDKGLQIGIYEQFDPATFTEQKLIGRFFKGRVHVGDPDANGKVWPEITRFYLIDAEEFHDVTKAAEDSSEGGEAAPF